MTFSSRLFFGSLFLLGLSLPLVHSTQAVSVSSCAEDYYSFIVDVRSENTRQGTLNDFIKLPYCQLNDILELESELDYLKDGFRNAAFSCESTTAYKAQFQEILMEQYFVRNVQKSSLDAQVDEEALLARVYENMYAVFVLEEGRVSESVFDDYFEAWSGKYKDRIGDYNACEEGPWAELEGTWAHFVETLAELKVDVEDSGAKSLKEIATPEVDVGVSKSFLSTWEYVKSLANKKKSELTPPPTVKSLSQSDEVYSFDKLFGVLATGDELYAIESSSADRMSRYTYLYGAGGAVASTDMQGILIELNHVLEESNTKDFPSIEVAAAKIYDKQCN